jgi:hypothetical protein
MATNIAVRRAAKAQRRKAIVAQKRRADMEAVSTAGQVRLAVASPIQHCLLSGGLFGNGMGMLVLARGATQFSVVMAAFLLDTHGMGVKNVFIRSLGRLEFAAYVARMSMTSPMLPVDPGYARKLLHELAAWAYNIGFKPHPDYAAIERIFGATDTGACGVEFQFGHGGKPLLIGDASGSMEFLLESTEGLTIDTGNATYPVEAKLEEPDSSTAPWNETN